MLSTRAIWAIIGGERAKAANKNKTVVFWEYLLRI
jgi:hypothetical protein